MKEWYSWLWLGALTAVGWAIGVGFGPGEVHAAEIPETYTQQEIATLPYGNGPHQVGVFRGNTDEAAHGPRALDLTPGNEIAILDGINRRLVLVAADGKQVRTVPLQHDAQDLAIGPDGTLFLLSIAQGVVHRYEANGTFVRSMPIPKQVHHVRGIQVSAGGAVELTTLLQRTYRLDAPDGPKQALFGHNRQFQYYTRKSSATQGELWAMEGARPAEVKAQEPRLVVSLTSTGRLGALRFITTDSDGAIYLLVETLSSTSPLQVQRTIHVYEPEGALRGQVPLPSAGAYSIERDLVIGADGDIYLMSAQAQHLRLLRFVSAKEAK